METKYRRKNYFIDKEFQSKLIIRIIGFTVLSSLISIILLTAFFYIFTLRDLSKSDKIYQLTDDKYELSSISEIQKSKFILKESKSRVKKVIIPSVIVSFLITSFISIVTGIFLSHRIAGPIFNLNRSINKIQSGDLSQLIKIRAKDEFQIFAANMEKMRKVLIDRISSIQNNIEQYEKSYDDKEKERHIYNIKEELEFFNI